MPDDYDDDFYHPPKAEERIPKDKSYPEDSVQCNDCGGFGCKTCDDRGWLTPKWHHKGRECENFECRKPIEPNCYAVYCSNECAMDDADGFSHEEQERWAKESAEKRALEALLEDKINRRKRKKK